MSWWFRFGRAHWIQSHTRLRGSNGPPLRCRRGTVAEDSAQSRQARQDSQRTRRPLRTHEIVIPYNTSHNLAVPSAEFELGDDKGQAISPNKPSLIKATPGAGLPTVVVNVSKGAK